MSTPAESYRSNRNLPPLAGLGSIADAAKPGLSVEACVTRLKRYHYAFRRLHEILTARITAEPIYELKTAFSHHAYLCAEHVEAIRTRVGEMREPPLGLEAVPHPALEQFFDEIRAAPTTEEVLVGLYQLAIPELQSALGLHLHDTNPLADAPSVRVCRFARLELEDMRAFGEKAVQCLVDDDAHQLMSPWVGSLFACLGAAAGMDGVHLPPMPPGVGVVPDRIHSGKPWKYDPVPRRDGRFTDLFNQGVNAEAFIYDESLPAKAKAVMMLFKRLREIDVPEMMASIIVETTDKPWGYFRDMTRQLWDEARHAMLGEVGFASLGVDWTHARVTHNWSLRLNTECSPMERHAVLYFIEQGLMTRTGKRYEWELATESGLPLMATVQDYDWADEVLHAAIGREWYVPQFGSLKEALEYGDRCWSRILSNWQAVKDQGLTEHANWWPAVYLQACRTWGEPPDAKALAFDTTYEGKRGVFGLQIHAGGPMEVRFKDLHLDVK
jgi:hypothetical protein